jgi:hypothetical protein
MRRRRDLMTIIRKQMLPVALSAGLVCLIGAGLATAKYVSEKTASNATARVAATTGNGSADLQPTPQPIEPMTIPENTAITVRLDHSLDSAENHAGDTFEAHVAAPVVVDNHVVIPEGAEARGRVVAAVRSGHLSHPGHLEIALTRVQVDGKWFEVATHDTSRKGGSHRNNNLGWIGGGGVGGALIGGLAAGGKGALIGGPIGAGAGIAVATLTGKRNVHLPAETELRFYTSRPVPATS